MPNELVGPDVDARMQVELFELESAARMADRIFNVFGWNPVMVERAGFIGSNGQPAVGITIGGQAALVRTTNGGSFAVIGKSFALVGRGAKYDLVLVYDKRPILNALDNKFITNQVTEAMRNQNR